MTKTSKVNPYYETAEFTNAFNELAELSISHYQSGIKKGQNLEGFAEDLYSEEGQDIAARHFYRPRNPKIAEKYKAQFPMVSLFTIDDAFRGWTKAQAKHFNDGGIFDEIYQPS